MIKRLAISAVCIGVLAACSSTMYSSTNTSTNLSSGIVQENMDKSVRPQDNFYRYVNGEWHKTHEIPGDRKAIGAFYDLREGAKEDVLAIIKNVANSNNQTKGSNAQKVADMYNSVMDIDTRNKLGVAPLKKDFAEIDQLKSKDELSIYMAKSQKEGASNPLGYYINEDSKNSTQYASHIWQWGLSLPDRDYYLKDDERYNELRKGYVEHIEKMFNMAGFSQAKQRAEQIMQLETALAEKHWTRVESRNRDKTYNKLTISELNTLAGDFNWRNYFKELGLPEIKEIIINQPSFVEGFSDVYRDFPLDAWKNYMRWQWLHASANYLSDDFEKENFEFFSKQLSGQSEQDPRWKTAVATVNASLGEIIGQLYVDKHFQPEAKQRMVTLVENLRKAYGESIDDLEWMGDATKTAAREKLAKFIPKIGYPDKWIDYSALNINKGDLATNMRNASRFEFQRELKKLGGPIQRHEWHMTPQTVNAYYNPTKNEIVFPAAILQPPFFNMEADDAVNYGAIGAVIGHEMGHGFDDQGSKFDGDGNLKNWWTDEDRRKFKERTAQLVKQYGDYKPLPDMHINGELTLGENIGDLAGVTIAYKAYRMSLNGKEAPVIDGFTGDERFFMGFGQVWRTKYQELEARRRLDTDPHSPAEYRAVGSLSNLNEFYKTYGVKEGDGMYIAPEKRVKIW